MSQEIRDAESTTGMPVDATEECIDESPRWAAVQERLAFLGGQIGRLVAAKEEEQQRESLLKELHTQLQEARAGLHWKILRTVLSDLVRLHDDLERFAGCRDLEPESLGKILGELRQDVLDILDRQGFSPYATEGNCFDSKRQQPTSTRDAPESELIGTVADRIALGFASDERILRPEKVVVFVAPRNLATS